MNARPRLTHAPVALAAVAAVFAFAPGVAGAEGLGRTTLEGNVLANEAPVTGAQVDLYATGRDQATKLGSGTTDAKGAFTISYSNPGGDGVLYAIATGGRVAGRCVGVSGHARGAGCIGDARRMMSVVGAASSPPASVFVTEQTTVASVFALARFIRGTQITGSSPGLPNAAATAANLAEAGSGKVSFVLANSPNGNATETLPTFNTLANVLVSCTTGTQKACARLFEAAAPPRGSKPRDTMEATFDIARNPASNRHTLFKLAADDAYAPALGSPPSSWILALVYTGGGMDAPGRMAFDAQGNAWIGNNFEQPGTTAGKQLTVLSPTGQPILGTPIDGGGLDAVGYGTAIDQQGRAWLGNFTGNSISLFSSKGTPISPSPGYGTGQIDAPQGIAVDQAGSLWIPNFGNGTVTVYRQGDPANFQVIRGGGLAKPFAVAIDQQGNAWVTNNSTSSKAGSVTEIRPDGTPTPNSPIKGSGLRSPQGAAVDRAGNVWVSDLASRSVVEITPEGQVKPPYRPESIDGPWGIAVDGDDNVWVAGFLNQRITLLCGRKTSSCPPGSKTGDPISPSESGFTNRGLQHMTAIQVDPSGNVWVANNWSNGSSLGHFVGGNGLVELVGAGAPVKTPLIGPPRRP